MSRLNPNLIKRVAEHIRLGWSKESICAKVGISNESWNAWVNRGKDIMAMHNNCPEDARAAIKANPDFTMEDKRMMPRHVDFYVAVRRATGEVVGAVEQVAYCDAMDGGKNTLTWLERRHPARWNAKQAPPVVINTQPIKQIIIHAGDTEPEQIEEAQAVEAEYEDV